LYFYYWQQQYAYIPFLLNDIHTPGSHLMADEFIYWFIDKWNGKDGKFAVEGDPHVSIQRKTERVHREGGCTDSSTANQQLLAHFSLQSSTDKRKYKCLLV